jgi:uncharacterized protein (DUF697 family)
MDDFRATLKRILEGDLDVANDEEKQLAVRRLIHTGCAAAMVTTLQPVPLLDVALITPIQIGMVQGIGRLHGYHLDRKSVLEMLNSIKTGLATQHATIAAAKLVPAAGEIFAACVAHGLTYAVGSLADDYFRSGRTMLPSAMRLLLRRSYSENLRRICRSTWNETLAFFRLGGGPPGVKHQLQDLQHARREGRLSDEEVEREVEKMLRER